MLKKDFQIKKFPYLAFSPNIMEYFAIIGYQENFVPQILDSYSKKKNIYSPKILSSITSNTDYGIVDNNLIIGQIYPENPLTILINKNDTNQEPPPTSNIIYYFCFDSTNGKEKLFYNCFAFKFYERYRYYITSTIFEEYYIPKAFCIISQYCYFSFFEYICRNIYTMMTQKENNSLPVEITIYNIVNFIPSPINYGLNLDLFSYALDVPNIEIGQLSGYPYLDFDLSEIFNLLPLNMVIEIYILTFLEQSMIFFSSNLELLNMVMFIMYELNYPCNDSTYFWHIVSFSKDNFVDENQFVGKLMVSLIGVNTSYNDDFDTSPFSKVHYIVDIDNKKIFLKQSLNISEDDMKDYENSKEFDLYIQSIIKEKDKNIESIFLKAFIERLKKSLEFILSKNPDFSLSPKNKYVNFFKSSKEIMDKNKKIQEIFYDFCLNILTIFYQDNSFNNEFDKVKKDNPEESNKRLFKLRNIDENTEMNINEQYFCDLFRSAIKYKIYFENFILNFESIELYSIPLIFSEEFTNIKQKDLSNKLINKLSLFSIIDSLYFPNNQQYITITLNNIYSAYLEKLKKYFKQFNSPNNAKKKFGRQLIKINKNILNEYIFLLNNFYDEDELMDLFPSIRIQKGELISKIDKRYISYSIQNYLEQKNQIQLPNYLIYALVYIFAISIPLHSHKKILVYLNNLINRLSKVKFFIRQHIFIIFKTFYKLYFLNKEQQIYPYLNFLNIEDYFRSLIFFLQDNLLFPNEEMMIIIKKFFGELIHKERDNLINISKGKEIDNEVNFKIRKNINFICFMKHCFTSKKVFKPSTMVKAALKENNNCNIIIRAGVRQLQPTVEIKIKKYNYSSEFFSPKKIYKLIQHTYNDFYENANLDMTKLKIKNVRDVIANLILYGEELNQYDEFIPQEFLTYTLYLFKNHEEKYCKNKK